MGKKRVMVPMENVDLKSVKYEREVIQAPHLTGFALKLFVWFTEVPVIGSLIISFLKKQNKMNKILRNTVIPERPMFGPEFPPQEPESGVLVVEEDAEPVVRVEAALKCLPPYDPVCHSSIDSSPFLYWKIRDYAHAYRSGHMTPSMVAEHVIMGVEEFNNKKPPMPLLISFDVEEVRKQAAASTLRFKEGNPLSILDGIFVAIKDDIDCSPYPTKGATTWFHEVRPIKEDAACVSKLRSCGVIFIGKANMHELGLGTTGNNSNYGTARNPHALERYTGGSSSGPAAIVASGLCSAALGTDGGGSIRIPSSLCGVVGFKTTYGRTDMEGSLCDCGTVEIIGPIASTVEDVMLVYAAILGSSPPDRISLNPSPPCLPNLSSYESSNALRSLRLGKYSEWFNDVYSTDISDKCENVLNMLSRTHGCETVEIVIPELQEMRTAHIVSIGSEGMCSLMPYCQEGKGAELTYDTRTNLALFESFSASDYIAAQRLRRRIMHYHMEIFKNVDIIVTPTTGMTAPIIPKSSLKLGESNLQVSGYLMRFIIAGNLLGLPAISVPVGHDKQGLPIGLQLIGRPWAEASVLRLASAVEELCAESRKRPSTFYDILKVGLVIGKICPSIDRGFVFDLIPTPPNDGGEPACYLSESSNKDDKKKGSKGKPQSQSESSSLVIDIDWVAEHARQVSRMLLGGMNVVGVYVWASESSYKNSSINLWQTVKEVAQAAASFDSDLDESLLIHISYSPRRWACRNCTLGSTMTSTSLRPSDFKMGRVLASLQTFRCVYNFDIRLPIYRENVSKANTLCEILQNGISRHAKELKSAKAIIDGNLVVQDQPCTSDGLHEVELLLPFMKDSPFEACSQKEVLGVVVFRGTTCSYAYLSPKEPISEAVADLRADIIMSLKSRLEIISDEAEEDVDSTVDVGRDASTEISTETSVSQLDLNLLRKQCSLSFPRRVFVPWVAGAFICDYLQPSETFQALEDHFKELMSMEAPIDVSTIIEPETEATSLMIKSFWDAVVPGHSTSGSVSHSMKDGEKDTARKEISREPMKSTTFNIVIPIAVLLLAILVGFVFFLRDPKSISL
ncbi:Amidase [Macleaya cordata]|uniref:Amidase n=1 Tax=Macleaya cordata TaxID=56857 RepID=A0A200QHY9_MACCD|nr:Amidase [Macleaya cordata]